MSRFAEMIAEFGDHQCEVCGSDCAMVADKVEQLERELAASDAKMREWATAAGEAKAAQMKAERDAVVAQIESNRGAVAMLERMVYEAREQRDAALAALREALGRIADASKCLRDTDHAMCADELLAFYNKHVADMEPHVKS